MHPLYMLLAGAQIGIAPPPPPPSLPELAWAVNLPLSVLIPKLHGRGRITRIEVPYERAGGYVEYGNETCWIKFNLSRRPFGELYVDFATANSADGRTLNGDHLQECVHSLGFLEKPM